MLFSITLISEIHMYLNFSKNAKDRINHVAAASIYYPKIRCYKYKIDVSLTWNDALGI